MTHKNYPSLSSVLQGDNKKNLTRKKIKMPDKTVTIPEELQEFIKQDTYSLIIKGHTGTGKTALALTILRELCVKANCLYISTRISPDQLFQYYPWLQKFYNKSKKTQLSHISRFNTSETIFADARLDDPLVLFERITNELMDVKAPTIVIDSSDAVGLFQDKETMINNARVMQAWRERAKAKLIIISEYPGDTTFDSLADGIVNLEQKYYNERLVREIYLTKLRGIRINRPSYFFSLNNNIFHSYDCYNPADFVISKYSEEFPKKTMCNCQVFNDSRIISGYDELDNFLRGGFSNQSIISIHLDPHISVRVALKFLIKITSNFISTKNPVLFGGFEGIEADDMSEHMKSLSPDKDLIMIPPKLTRWKGTANSYVEGKKDIVDNKQLQGVKQSVLEIRKKYPDKHLLGVIGPDLIQEFQKTNAGKDGINPFTSFIRSNTILTFFVLKDQNGGQDYLSKMSDMQLRISEIKGTLFLSCQLPWSPLYAIIPDKNQGYPEINIEPMN